MLHLFGCGVFYMFYVLFFVAASHPERPYRSLFLCIQLYYSPNILSNKRSFCARFYVIIKTYQLSTGYKWQNPLAVILRGFVYFTTFLVLLFITIIFLTEDSILDFSSESDVPKLTLRAIVRHKIPHTSYQML